MIVAGSLRLLHLDAAASGTRLREPSESSAALAPSAVLRL